MVDWRANRLVDALAKTGAAITAPSDGTTELVKSAEALVKHRLAQLAQATYRANHHTVTSLSADGDWTTKVLRDSTSRPIGTRRSTFVRNMAKKVSKKKRCIESVKPWTPPPTHGKSKVARTRKAAQRAAAKAQLNNALKRTAAALQPCTGKPAAQRFVELTERVQKKQMTA